MIQQPSLLATKYARAYLNVFGGSWTFDTKTDAMLMFLKKHHSLLSYNMLSSIDHPATHKIFTELVLRFNLPESFKKLLNLLLLHKRLVMLADVVKAIHYEYKKRHNIVSWDIISSHLLTDGQLKVIQKYLERKTDKIIEMRSVVDERLIAGICLQSSTLSWEQSIRKKLCAIMSLKDVQ